MQNSSHCQPLKHWDFNSILLYHAEILFLDPWFKVQRLLNPGTSDL